MILCDLDDQVAARIGEALQGARLDRAVFNAGIYRTAHQDPRQVSRAEIAQLFLGNAIAPRAPGTDTAGEHPRRRRTGLYQLADGQCRAGPRPGHVAIRCQQDTAEQPAAQLGANGSSAQPARPAPGWVRTELGGADAPLSVEDSVSGLIEVIAAWAGQPGCRFLDHQGQVLPW